MSIDFSKLTPEELRKLLEQTLASQDAAQVPPLDPPRDVAALAVADAPQSVTPETSPRRTLLTGAAPSPDVPKEEPAKRNLLSGILPETEDGKAALRRSILLAGAQMMASGGPSLTPTNTLAVIGQGLNAGALGYDNYLNGVTERDKNAAAIKTNQFKLQSELQADGLRSRISEILTKAKGRPLTNDELFELAALQTKAGDEAGARDSIDKAQKLQQTMAGKGLTQGENGYIPVAGAEESATRMATAEDAGKAPSSVKEYNFYVEQENAAGRTPKSYEQWSNTGKTAASGKPSAEDTFLQKTAEHQAKTFDDLSSDAIKARRDVSTIGELDTALRSNPGGFSTGLQNAASQIGIKLGENASQLEYANALINQLVPQQRPPGSGAMSDMDLKMFKQSLPQLMNTPEGNRLILDTMSAMGQYRIKIGEIAQRAQTGEITRQQALAEMATISDPMAEFKKRHESKDPGKEGSPVNTNMPQVGSKGEGFADIPVGTRYRGPDGKIRIK